MKTLNISNDLQLPLDAVTQTIGILAVRGAGKTNTGAALAEEMFKAGLHFVAIDPVGSWKGLRSARDGKSPGLPIPIFGGKWGDVPLESGAGNLIADLIVEKRLSCVLDISEFDSETQKKKFLLDFAVRLYRKNENPIHLFLEEADDFIPQRPMRDEAYLLRAWENIVRRGRARGIGLTLITQRSASLNKNVLTQVQTLIAMRTTGPQDRKAIEEWLKYHDAKMEILESLPQLADGEAWVWSPQWLKITKRVKFRQRETFDSGATPKEIKGNRPAATLADVDLSAIQNQMKDTIEKAKSEDPRELLRQIAELKKQLQKNDIKPEIKIERVEVPILKDSQIDRLEKLAEKLHHEYMKITEAVAIVRSAHHIERVASSEIRRNPVISLPSKRNKITPQIQRPITSSNHSGRNELTPSECAVIDAVASFPSGATRQRIAVFSGRSIKSSSFQGAFPSLVSKGLIKQVGDRYQITESGSAISEPMTAATLDDWLRKLKPAESKVLKCLVDNYPGRLTREGVSEITGQSTLSSSFQGAFPALRDLELIEGSSDFAASENLFL